VCILAGTRDWDGVGICAECGFKETHAIHQLDQTVQVEATALEQRKLGELEGSDG
jgi:hypothetical protein